MSTVRPGPSRSSRPSRPVKRLATLLAALAVLPLAAACGDDGPSGPGSLDGVVRGPEPLGAVVLEVRGEGIVGFEEEPGTRVFSAPIASSGGQGGAGDAGGTTYRVVLVGEEPGGLGFRVRVEDRRATAPTATVISASDADDQSVSAVGGIQVDIGSQG